MSDSPRPPLPSGLVVFVKRDCPTCELVVPVLEQLAQGGKLTLFCQDDPSFPEGAGAVDDTSLERSWHHAIETVPTLLAVEEGIERSRTEGWDRAEWERLSGVAGLGSDLPAFRPGCGSLSVDPEYALDLAVRFGADTMKSRRVKFAAQEDEMEAAFERGWTDGLPVVPPTERRVLAMLQGTRRKPDEVVAVVPPDLVECTVEKVAINAVMAGCLPEYFPVVLAIVEAIAHEEGGLHGGNASTGGMALGFVVNGPVRSQIDMNFRGNTLGPGNRANSTIGRAVRLCQINAMGAVPGNGNVPLPGREILDRSTLGQPAKYAGYHMAENEEEFPTLRPLHVELGFRAQESVVTVFPTSGHIQISAHEDHGAEAIVETIAHYLVGAGKLAKSFCAIAIPPEAAEHFVRDGWSKADARKAIHERTSRSVAWAKREGWVWSAGPIDARGGALASGDEVEQISVAARPDDILLVVAGGPAGAFIHAFLPYAGSYRSKLIDTSHLPPEGEPS